MNTLLKVLDALANSDWHKTVGTEDGALLFFSYAQIEYIIVLHSVHESIDIPLYACMNNSLSTERKIYQKMHELESRDSPIIPLERVFMQASAKRDLYESLRSVVSNDGEALYLTLHAALSKKQYMQPLEIPGL